MIRPQVPLLEQYPVEHETVGDYHLCRHMMMVKRYGGASIVEQVKDTILYSELMTIMNTPQT